MKYYENRIINRNLLWKRNVAINHINHWTLQSRDFWAPHSTVIYCAHIGLVTFLLLNSIVICQHSFIKFNKHVFNFGFILFNIQLLKILLKRRRKQKIHYVIMICVDYIVIYLLLRILRKVIFVITSWQNSFRRVKLNKTIEDGVWLSITYGCYNSRTLKNYEIQWKVS